MITYAVMTFPKKDDWGKLHKEGYKTLRWAIKAAEKLAQTDEYVTIREENTDRYCDTSGIILAYDCGKITIDMRGKQSIGGIING